MVMTDDMKTELSLRFKAIYEANSAIEQKKEEIKTFNAHVRETFKMLAEKLETKQKTVKEAYKEYTSAIENPEESESKNEIIALLQEFNLLGIEKA